MSAEALSNARRAVDHAADELKIATAMYRLAARAATIEELQTTGIELTIKLGTICTDAAADIKNIAASRIHPQPSVHETGQTDTEAV